MMLVKVVDQLLAEFDGRLPRSVIEVVVDEVSDEWRDARIQVFIPLLTARVARDRLRHAKIPVSGFQQVGAAGL